MVLLTSRIARLDYEEVVGYSKQKGWKFTPSKNEQWYATINESGEIGILLKAVDVVILSFKYKLNKINGSPAYKLSQERKDSECYPAALAMAERILDKYKSLEGYLDSLKEL